MRINKTLGVGLVALLLASMVVVGVNTVPVTRLCVDPCWNGYDPFLVKINVTDVEDLYSFEFKLAWDKTLFDLVAVNITSPEEWNTNCIIFRNETMQDYNGTHGRYWLNMSALSPAPSFNGSTILVKLTFDVTGAPAFPDPAILAHLDLYDTILTDSQGSMIAHEVHDGYYLLPAICPCLPELRVMAYAFPVFGENFTVDVEVKMYPQFYLTDWKAKLGYNTTLLEVIAVEEGPFLKNFREADRRYFTVNVNEEEGYVNMTGGIWGTCDRPSGSGSLAKVIFNVTYKAQCGDSASCVLDLYDTNLTESWTSPLPHTVYDLFYQAPFPELVGDINKNRIVDIQDIVLCALAFGSAAEDNPETPWDETEYWNPNVDLNNDEIVDIVDLVIIAIHFGETC